MNAEVWFKSAGTIAFVGWVLLAVLGRQRWVSQIMTAVIIPLLLGIAYAIILALHFGASKGDFNSLSGVAELFSNRWLLLAGWLHYLAFDLFIGSWQVRDAASHGISHWLVLPCLLLTFLFGPIGLILYLLLRAFVRREFFIQ